MRLDNPVQLRILVAAGEEQRAVDEVGEPRAEDVEARIDGGRRVRPRHGVVDGGSREVVHRKALRRAIADGVPGQHLAVRQQGHVNADDRPVDDRAPLPDLTGIVRDRGGGHPRLGGGTQPRLPAQPCLGRRVVDDLVLGPMALRGVDGVRRGEPREA